MIYRNNSGHAVEMEKKTNMCAWLHNVLLLSLIVIVQSHDLSSGHSHCEFNYMILVDSSGSIKDQDPGNWDIIMTFLEQLIDDIDAKSPVGTDSKIAIFSYSYMVDPDIQLGQSLTADQIKKQIADGKIRYQGSITRMFMAVKAGRAHLEANVRMGRDGFNAQQVLILFTDGKPYSSDLSHGETAQNVLQELYKMMLEEIHVIMIGIGDGADKSTVNAVDTFTDPSMTDDFGRGKIVSDFSGLTSTFAQTVLDPLEINCGFTPTQAPVTPSSANIDLIIVIDDTSQNAWSTSYSIMNTLVSTQLMMYINNGALNVRIVTSTQAVAYSQINTLSRQTSGSSRLNLLLQALNMAYLEFLSLQNNGRYKVVLVIHTGIIDSDQGQNLGPMNPSPNINSVRYVVWYQLKFLIGADIFTIPLPRAPPIGIEILQRITSKPGPPLTTAVNIMSIINQYMPTYDPCQNIDLVFLLDVSGSSNLAQVKNNVRAVMTFLRNNVGQQTRVALVALSEYANILFDLEAGQISDQTTYNNMLNTVNSLQTSPQSGTNIALGVYMASQLVFGNHGDRRLGTNHIVVFSDGQANIQTDGLFGLTPAFQASGTVVNSTIHFLTSGTGQALPGTITMNSNTIGSVFQSQLQAFRNCPSATPVNPCLNMVIVFDSSGSLEDDNRDGHRHVKNYVATLVERYYTTYATRARNMGTVHYASTAEILVNYRNHAADYANAISIIKGAKHLGGRTNVPHALELGLSMVDGLPQSDYGLIFMTDGESNEGGMDGGAKVRQVLDGGHSLFGIFLSDHFENRHAVMRGHMADEDELFVRNFYDLPNEKNIKWAMDKICPPVTT